MDSTTDGSQLSAERSEYYSQIQKHSMAPLWENLNHLLTPEPEVKSVPHLWDYSELRSLLLESADVISAAEAERRVLMLENPGLPGNCSITESLYGGLQLIMPGEIAPAHRHSPAALRFIIEGSGAYTSVNGEKLSWSLVTSLSHPPGLGTTMVMKELNQSCGWMVWIFPWLE